MQYSIKAAAMATGVSASCLRTWERRYGVPKPRRSDSGRRIFGEDDLAVIRRMVALVESGVSASEAAQAVEIEGIGDPPEEEEGNGRTHPLVDLFVQKARRFEQGWLLRIVRDSVFSTGWPATVERIVFPALRRLGEEWAEANICSAPIQFAAEVLHRELWHELAAMEEPDGEAPVVLLAGPEDEAHDLGLLVLALMLQERGAGVLYLGTGTPCADLIEAVQAVKPEAVCLTVTTATSLAALHRTARSMISSRLGVQLFIGGPGLRRKDAPSVPGIRLPQSLPEAADRVIEAMRENGATVASSNGAGA